MSKLIKSVGVLLVGLTASSQSFAAQATISDVVGHYLNIAVESAVVEIQNQVYSDILNAAHHVSLEETKIETRVLIAEAPTETVSENEAAE